MATVNLEGFDTQMAPMKAINEILNDYYNNHINSKEAMEYINAINCEWKF